MAIYKLLKSVAVFGVLALALMSASTVLAAPGYDNFANAMQISALPFSIGENSPDATNEVGEPTPNCFSSGSLNQTLWYRYTANTSQSLTASISVSGWGGVGFGVWAGDNLTSLTQVACAVDYPGSPSQAIFHVDAGKTYYFQVGTVSNSGTGFNFGLNVTPPPLAYFYANPFDPSTFDTVQFYDYSYDPLYQGFKSWAWDFGDGSNATGQSPAHRYASDGDYTVTLAVTTNDGRTASTSQTISVRTHDVSIIKFTVPNAAGPGQTRHATVEIKNNTNYGETVRVEFYKSVVGGYQLVGTLQQSVPVRSSNNTVSFDFSYTFTTEDAVLGKVTFKAVVSLVNARDALPADNQVIALPTKVNK